MKSDNELKEIDIKNRMCYYFNDIMRVVDIDFYKLLLDERSNKNILTYDISYKTFMGTNPLRIKFDEIDGFIKVYDGIRNLVLFGPKRYNAIYDRINYLISEKSDITQNINHNVAKIRIYSYNPLTIVKTLTFHNAIIPISQLLIRTKITTTIISFYKNLLMRMNPIHVFLN